MGLDAIVALLVSAAKSHAWPIVAWGVILIGVYILKLPSLGRLWQRLPDQYRIVGLAALGCLSGVGQAVLAQQPWIPILVTNILASLAAPGFDQLVSRFHRGQVEKRNSKRPPPPIPVAMLVLVLGVTGCLGCSWLQGACASAMPSLVAAQGYSQEASNALDQAVVLAQALPVTAETRAIILASIDKARATLRLAQTGLLTATDACSAPDILTLFQDFVQAWTAVEVLFGNNLTPGNKGLAPPAVVAPAIVRYSRAHRKAGVS